MAGVVFSDSAAKRIAEAVRKVEAGPGGRGVGWHPYRARGESTAIVIGKTTAAWAKGTTATVAVWAGDPLADTGETVTAVNLFADIETGKWVAMLGGYLISAEC